MGACDESASGGPGKEGTTSGQNPDGPTPAEIDDCHHACDELKIFRCNDSGDQATCYANCGHATSDQIELFTACVQASTCDPTCSVHIKPKGSTGPGGGGSSEG